MTIRPPRKRRGLSLLEVVMATGLMGLLMTPVVMMLQLSGSVWHGYCADHQQLEQQNAVIRHLVRNVRSADAILDTQNNQLVCLLANGEKVVWEYRDEQVFFHNQNGADVLATGVNDLQFLAFQADAVTPATSESDTALVKCTIVTVVDGGQRKKVMESWVRAPKT